MVDGYLDITPITDEYEITVTGNSDTKVYNTSEQSVNGYTVSTYDSTINFTGLAQDDAKATAKGTNVGTYTMTMTKDDFSATSENYTNIKITVVPGTLEITPITDEYEITVTGNSDTKVYNGTEQSVNGYTVSAYDSTINFTGLAQDDAKATAKGTNVGVYTMTMAVDDFGATSTNYTNIKITVVPGKLTITPITDKVTVTITENSGSEKYDGVEKTVTGYTVTSISNTLYTEADFTFSGNDTVKGTDAGTYQMELKAADFTNISKNFTNVEFVIVDGTLKISKRTVTLTSANGEKTYDGTALTKNAQTDVTVGGDGFVTGEGATYDITGTQTLVGNSKNTFTYTLNEGTKAGNYDITQIEGILTVTDDKVKPEHVVKKTVDSKEYALGATVTFNIEVTNIYDHPVTILLSEIDGVTLAQSKFEGVEAGKTVNTTATYTITEADILAGSFTNTVTATVQDLDKTAEATAAVEAPNGHLTIEKETTSDPENGATYALGETITYKVNVINDGNLTITDITVTDELTGDEWTIDSLAPGASKDFPAEYVVTEEDILAGKVVNEATATGTSPDPDNPDVPVDPGDTEDDTDKPNGHITIKKATTSKPANGETYALGEKIEYKITATNDGNLTITGITVTDDLTGDKWTITSLAPGASEEFKAEYVVTEEDILAGKVKNVATATGTSPDPDKPDVPVDPGETEDYTDKPNGHITIEKVTTSTSKDEKGYTEGEKISYKITVVNDGNLTITGITVTDDLTGDKWTIESLAPGAAKEFETTYTVTAADAAAGKVLNVATAKGTSPDPKNPEVPVTPGEDPEPTYEIKFTLTIRYWIGSKDGELINTVTRVEKAGTEYDVATPPMEGYTADTERVKGVLDKDMEYDVVYTAEDYTLTILYVYQDGTEAAETYTEVLHFGDEYSVESPVINGYYTNKKKVEGTMPARDVTVTVIYVKNQVVITIDDFETPLGLGLGGINVGETIE